MENKETSVSISQGYTGAPKARAKINGKEFVLDIEYIENLLATQIEEKGYTVSQSKRQKYPRITINS